MLSEERRREIRERYQRIESGDLEELKTFLAFDFPDLWAEATHEVLEQTEAPKSSEPRL